jgi:hypothetical protein
VYSRRLNKRKKNNSKCLLTSSSVQRKIGWDGREANGSRFHTRTQVNEYKKEKKIFKK